MENKKEMSLEELKGAMHQMSEQGRALYNENQKLHSYIKDLELNNFFKRLDYLFRILSEDSAYLSDEFKIKCAAELENAMLMSEGKEDTEETQGAKDTE